MFKKSEKMIGDRFSPWRTPQLHPKNGDFSLSRPNVSQDLMLQYMFLINLMNVGHLCSFSRSFLHSPMHSPNRIKSLWNINEQTEHLFFAFWGFLQLSLKGLGHRLENAQKWRKKATKYNKHISHINVNVIHRR